MISNQHQRVIHFRDIRPHLLAESTTFEPNSEVIDVPRGTLKVCGFVRGKNLSVNRLVHLPGYGDFQMSQVGILAAYLQQCLNIINISKGLVEIDHLYRAYQQISFTLDVFVS